jgi:hypothetical protein
MHTSDLIKIIKAEFNKTKIDRVTIARLINQADRLSILTLNYGPVHPDYDQKNPLEVK